MKLFKRLHGFFAILIFCFLSEPLLAAQGEFLPVWKGSNGTPLGYYEYLPQGYDDHPASNYPILFFWHGLGELGNGTTDLAKIQKYGVAKMLSNGNQFPAIVICAQTTAWEDTTNLHRFTRYIETNLARSYRIDTRFRYMTGLSMGGGYTWKYAKKYPTELTAIVTVCGAAGTSPGDLSALSGLKIRSYHNLLDPTVPVAETYAWVQAVKNGGGKVALSLYARDTHDAWTEAYAEQALWDWLWAQPSPNQTPEVDAGPTVIHVTQSNALVSLSGTASDDGLPSALKTSWYRRAGPSRFTFADSNALATTVTVETTNRTLVTNRLRLNAGDGQFKSLDEIFVVYTPPSDTNAPIVTASHYNRTTNQAFTLNLYTTEDNGYYSVNGGSFISFAAPMTSLTIDQTTTVLYYGRDSFGNTSATNQRVYIFDTSAPVVTASHYNRTTNQAFTLNLYTTEDNGYYSLNGGSFVSFAAPKVSLTINSTSTVLFFGRDSLGNTSVTNQRVYIFDTSAPMVDASRPSLLTNQAFTVSLTTTESSGYFSTNGSAFVSFTTTGTNLVIGATTTLLYYGRDMLGNSSATNIRVYTIQWGDITAPVVNVSHASLTTNESFTVSLSTTESYGYFSTNGSAYVAFSTSGTNLTIRETTSLSFYGRDTNGNTSDTNMRTYEVPAMIYENAENGTTNGWVVYDNDPSGATVVNVFDAQKNSRVIQVSGSGLINGYRRYLSDGKSYWKDRNRLLAEWSMKFSENFIIYFDVVTSTGNKYITYDASTNAKWLGTNTAGQTNYVYHGLGTASKNGTWQTFTRDLAADLADLLPGETLVEVNGLLIRGSGSVDDICLKERSAGAGMSALHLNPGAVPVVFVAETAGLWTGWSDPTKLPLATLQIRNLVAAVDYVEESVTLSFDLKKDSDQSADLRLAWSPSGQKTFSTVENHQLAVSAPIRVGGTQTLKWYVPKAVDRSKKIDLRVVGSLGEGVSAEAVALEIDLGKMFGLRTSLDKAAVVNSPWRGQGEGVGFMNLTEDARVEIYSAVGKLLAILPASVSGKSVWDVRDRHGAPVAPGVYSGLIISGTEKRSVKIMVLPR